MNFKDKYKVRAQKEKFYRVYNKFGKYIKDIDVNDENKLTSEEYLKGVTCFVINKKGEILIEKRANTKLTPDKLDLVSGHVDMDEIGRQSIIRELGEEVGILEKDAINVEKIDTKALGFESQGIIRNFFIEFYYLFINDTNLKMQKEEVNSLNWIPMKKVFELIENGKTKFPKENGNIKYKEIFSVVEKKYLEKIYGVNEKKERIL